MKSTTVKNKTIQKLETDIAACQQQLDMYDKKLDMHRMRVKKSINQLVAYQSEVKSDLKLNNQLVKDKYNNDLTLEFGKHLEQYISNTYFKSENLKNISDLYSYIEKNINIYNKFNQKYNIFKNFNVNSLLEEMNNFKTTISKLESGKSAKDETLRVMAHFFDETNRCIESNRISIKSTHDGRYINVENDIVFICKNGIFTLTVKNSNRDLTIDEKGNLVKRGEANKGQDIIQQCLNHVNVTERVLKEELSKLDIRNNHIVVNPIIVTANNVIDVEKKNDRIPILLKNEIQDYMFKKYKPQRILTQEEIDLYYSILKQRDIGLAEFAHGIDIENLISQISMFIAINKYKSDVLSGDYNQNTDEIIALQNRIKQIQMQIDEEANKLEIINNLKYVFFKDKLVRFIGIVSIGALIITNPIETFVDNQLEKVSICKEEADNKVNRINNLESVLVKENKELEQKLKSQKNETSLLQSNINSTKVSTFNLKSGTKWDGWFKLDNDNELGKIKASLEVNDQNVVMTLNINGEEGKHYLLKDSINEETGLINLTAGEWIEPINEYEPKDYMGVVRGNTIKGVVKSYISSTDNGYRKIGDFEFKRSL